MAMKSLFTSGMSTPAWLRMKATAKSGSMPPLQSAKMLIVPVGATVVTLQLRSLRVGADARAIVGARGRRIRTPDAALPFSERAACFGQAFTLLLRFLIDERT